MTASANNTTLTPHFITDAAGGIWCLTPSAIAGAQVRHNGVDDTTTFNVTLLLYHAGTMYHANLAGNFYQFQNPGWAATSDPRLATVSANNTTVTTVGPVITDGNLVTWSLVQAANASTGMQIAVNGVVDAPTNNVIKLVYAGGYIYQENSSLLWWRKAKTTDAWSAASNPQTVTPAAGGPPPQAVAAGYTHPVMIDEFAVNSVSPDGTGVYNWYGTMTGATPLSASEAFVANGLLNITTDNTGYGSGLNTTNSNTPAISKPGAIAQNTGQGLAFQYGYFECSMKWDPNGYTSTSWPAFWSWSVQGNQNPKPIPYLELDFIEAYPANGMGSAAGGPLNIITTIHNWENQTTSAGIQNSNNLASLPAGYSQNGFNTYGCLWTPTEVQWFVNNVLVTRVPTTVPTSVAASGGGTGTTFNAANMCQNFVVLGTGKNFLVQVDYVHIWQ